MKPTEEQKNQLRKSISEVHPLRNECWAEIEPLIYVMELNKKDYFSKEGQTSRDLGFILNGILRIYYLSDNGDEWNKHFIIENNFVASSISPEKKSITNIQALSKTTMLHIPYFEFFKLSTKYNEINLFLQKLTFSYLEQKQGREISLLSENAMNNYLSFKKLYPDLENKIQHFHIASYLGVTPTQLSRLRKKLNAHQQM